MEARIATINSMVTVSIYLHVKLFISLHETFAIFCAVLEMHVIISHAERVIIARLNWLHV